MHCITPRVNPLTSTSTSVTAINEDRHMARRAFAVNDAVREKVRHLAGLGVPQDDIARMVGCAPKTLRKHLRDELDRGVAEANAMISGCLFAAAKAGNTAAMIFWLKTRARWRESSATETIAAADGEANSEILVLPDNCRDPEVTAALRDAQQKFSAGKRWRRELP
jgi:hypothetical protein